MKKIVSLLLAVMVFVISSQSVFAQSFEIVKTSPKNNETGLPMENLGVKIFFNEDVYNKDNNDQNQKAVKLVDEKNNEIGTEVFFNPKDKKVALVLLKAKGKDGKPAEIKEKSKYTLVVSEDFISADGSKLGKEYKTSFTTLNPATNTIISMVMMVLMIGVMIVASSRAMKKEKENAKNNSKTKVNPYKVSKQTGKSVDEIVAKEKARKEKERELEEEFEDDEWEDEVDEILYPTFKVKRNSSFSKVTSKYVEKKRAEIKKKNEIVEKIKMAQKGKKKSKKKK